MVLPFPLVLPRGRLRLFLASSSPFLLVFRSMPSPCAPGRCSTSSEALTSASALHRRALRFPSSPSTSRLCSAFESVAGFQRLSSGLPDPSLGLGSCCCSRSEGRSAHLWPKPSRADTRGSGRPSESPRSVLSEDVAVLVLQAVSGSRLLSLLLSTGWVGVCTSRATTCFESQGIRMDEVPKDLMPGRCTTSLQPTAVLLGFRFPTEVVPPGL